MKGSMIAFAVLVSLVSFLHFYVIPKYSPPGGKGGIENLEPIFIGAAVIVLCAALFVRFWPKRQRN